MAARGTPYICGAPPALAPRVRPGRGPRALRAGFRPEQEALLNKTFADFGVAPDIVEPLAAAGIVHPFPIQALAIPLALEGHDLIGQARTGTGKTIAFSVPLLQRITLPGSGVPQALVVVPTRELAKQVAGDVELAGRKLGVRVLQVYGGRAYEPQVEALKRGVDVVVGTPGRLLDLAGQRHLNLSQVAALVLDEADEMLDLGFLPDVERIVALLPTERHTMLFSATMPGPVVALSRRYLHRPTHVRAESPDETATVPSTQQHVFRVHGMDKPELLARILQSKDRGLAMVFCRTKRACDRLAGDLAERGFAAAPVHGDLGQGARERALRAFRNGKVDVLVATDVAARGIDVSGVTHVINHECPDDEKTYLHRIGRTGRAGETGTAVTFVDWEDLYRWRMINEALDLPFPEPEETYSTSDHLFEMLDIPAGTKGTLPRDARTRAGLEAEEVEDLGETGKVRSRGPRRDDKPAERAPRTTRPRQRTRTRGARAGENGAASASSGETVPTHRASRPTEGSEAAAEGAPSRRRRSRGGRGRSGGRNGGDGAGSPEGSTGPTPQAESA